MSLDLSVLGADGVPERSVPISVELHQELMRLAEEHGACRLALFHGYYTDAEVQLEDLPELSQEIEHLRRETRSQDLAQLLSHLKALVAEAMASSRAIHAIAD